MQITLSQDELKDAVRAYVVNELGLDLTGRTLTTTFTATRGDAGVITNLSIQKVGASDDVVIPGYTNSAPDAEVNQPAAASAAVETKAEAKPKDKGAPAPVTTATLAPAVALSDTEAVTEPAAAATQEDAQVADSPAEAAAAVVAEPAKTSSLFG